MSLITVTQENFDTVVMQSEKKVLLDFWASWCGPCKMIGPLVEELAEERADIVVGKVNVDEQMELAVRFGVSSIPTLVVMDGGKVVGTAVGYRPKADIEALLG